MPYSRGYRWQSGFGGGNNALFFFFPTEKTFPAPEHGLLVVPRRAGVGGGSFQTFTSGFGSCPRKG